MKISTSTIDCTPYGDALGALKADLPVLPRADLPEFFSTAERLSANLPKQLRQFVENFRQRGNEDGFLRLTGLPIDEDNLPATPESWPAPADRRLLDMEAWIALFGVLLGKATGYRENRAGSVFQDVYPARGAHHMTAHNFSTELRYHTEMAYHADQPHYLAIACARADHDRITGTMIVSVRKVLRNLGEEERIVLRSVPLQWHVDLAFQSDSDPEPVTSLILLTGNDDILRYDRSLILPSDVGEVARAFQAFSAAVDAAAVPVYLLPGDLILVDNFRTAHARTPYTPRFDGTDRWLNRIFIRTPGPASGMRHAEVVPFRLRTAE